MNYKWYKKHSVSRITVILSFPTIIFFTLLILSSEYLRCASIVGLIMTIGVLICSTIGSVWEAFFENSPNE